MSAEASETSTFAAYVRKRFLESKLFRDLEKEIAACNKSRRAKVVVLKEPYPLSSAGDDDERIEDGTPGSSSAWRTELIRLLASRYEGDAAYRVFPFLDGRKIWTDEPHFYQDHFFPLVSQSFSQGLNYVGSRTVHVLGVLWNRACILVSVAAPTLFTALGAIVTLKTIEFFRKSENQDLLTAAKDLTTSHPRTLIALGFVLFVIWLMHAWGKVQTFKDVLDSWKSQKLFQDPKVFEHSLQERLMQDPAQILERLDRNRTLVFLVDDADCLDSKGLAFLLRLADAAVAKCRRFLLLLGYNPKNPLLLHTERSSLRQQFASHELIRKKQEEGCGIFDISPLSTSQVKAWLWDYHGTPQAEYVCNVLDRMFEEAETGAETLLSFFCALDDERKSDEPRDSSLYLSDDEMRRRFEKHLGRDEDDPRLALSALKMQPNERQCIEVLKYVLGFRSKEVRLSQLVDVTSFSATELDTCLDTLTRDMGLLVRHGSYVAFAHSHLRGFLQTSWPDWRNNKERYATVILNTWEKWGDEESADVALDAEASRLAIDVLWRRGEYEYNFFGASDAGYSLRYYGLQ